MNIDFQNNYTIEDLKLNDHLYYSGKCNCPLNISNIECKNIYLSKLIFKKINMTNITCQTLFLPQNINDIIFKNINAKKIVGRGRIEEFKNNDPFNIDGFVGKYVRQKLDGNLPWEYIDNLYQYYQI